MDSLKILSPTYSLSLTTSASDPLQIVPNTPTRAFRIAVINVGSALSAITFGTTSTNMATPSITYDGQSTGFVLPAAMFYPIILDCGAPNVFIKGISESESVIFVTLVANE